MKLDSSKHFVLFANCIPVRGFKSSIIMDLQRNCFLNIPNLFFDVLSIDLRAHNICELMNYFNNKYDKGITKYLGYLIDEEYGFLTNNPSDFPELGKEFYTPFRIITSVINFSSESPYKLGDVLSQLKDLGCQMIQLRLLGKLDLNIVKREIEIIKSSRIKIVEAFIDSKSYSFWDLQYVSHIDPRIMLFVCSDNIDLEKGNLTTPGKPKIKYVDVKLEAHIKEKICQSIFMSDISFYLESLNYNVGLHRKVSIDEFGEIKNFVNHSATFGNIMKNRIDEILDMPGFDKMWKLSNDKIEKCKDCQFRYMCLSNSDIEEKAGLYYKSNTCNFDPYLNVWDD